MKLITQTLANTLPAIGTTAELHAEEIKIYAKFFALGSAATWLVAEYDPEDRIAYGYADLYGQGTMGGAEWGSFSLDELESLKFMGIPRIEREIHFKPRMFSECVDAEGRIKV